MATWISYTSYSLYFDGSDMTADETEFVLAMASYQKRFERRYPTWREVLTVLHCLGYRKVAEPEPIDQPKPPRAADRDCAANGRCEPAGESADEEPAG